MRSTHFSTWVEGNRLTLYEDERVIRDDRAVFQGCERDASEVRNYWNARLAAVERADKNIDELLQNLNRAFYGLRKSGIDAELFDVISGFEALVVPK